jgi:hypothetical protein
MNADQSNHAGFAIALPQGDGRRGRVQFLFDFTVTGTLIQHQNDPHPQRNAGRKIAGFQMGLQFTPLRRR